MQRSRAKSRRKLSAPRTSNSLAGPLRDEQAAHACCCVPRLEPCRNREVQVIEWEHENILIGNGASKSSQPGGGAKDSLHTTHRRFGGHEFCKATMRMLRRINRSDSYR